IDRHWPALTGVDPDRGSEMSKFHELTVASVTRETRDAVAVTFAVPEELADTYRYLQGQHLTLRAGIDGEDVRRSYSICSAVQDNRLRVAIKRVNGGLFSTRSEERRVGKEGRSRV